MSGAGGKIELGGEELLCLVIRETGSRSWSGATAPGHRSVCRFCAGVLFARSDLERANMVLDDDGQPIPKG